MGLQEFLSHCKAPWEKGSWQGGREPGGDMTSFWQEAKGGEIGRNDCLSSLGPSLPSGCSTFSHFCPVRYFLTASRGPQGGGWCAGVEMSEGGQKDTSWISSSHPRRTPPCLAQLSAWRFTAEDFQNISRSMFTAKHTESIANYESPVHFILLPGVCPGDPSSQFVSEEETPYFWKFSHFSFSTCGLELRCVQNAFTYVGYHVP